MVSKKMAVKGRAILRSKSTIRTPDFNIMDYKLSMVRALNYYNAEVELKDKRKFVMEYWKTLGKPTSILNDLPDSWFGTLGAVAHMATNGIPLHEHDIIRLDNAYTQLTNLAKSEKTSKSELTSNVTSKSTKTVQDYIDDAAKSHIAEIEGMIDDAMKNNTTIDVKGYLTKNAVKSPVANKISEWYAPELKEFKLALTDKVLQEAYSNFGKRGLNKLIALVESIISDCGTVAQIARTTRAPRKRKEKPASVLAAKMQYLKEFVDLRLRSITPDKIVGADQAWLYNTKLRKLFKYQALDGYTLTIKGTTIQNFDPEKSGSKILRKPDVQLAGVSSMSKRPMSNLFNDVKATMGKATGRVSNEYIILGAFL